MGGRRVRNAQMGVRFPSSPVGIKALIIALLSPSSLPPLHVKRNIEVGVLMRHKSLAKRLCAHFDFLKQQKIVQRIT